MYPDPHGGGVLRLHATYRHDLKIKASDEGRVMKTAAAFTKGLLELEGNLTPILASLVTVEEKNRQMLDKGGNDEIKDDMDRCKEHMAVLLQSDVDMTDELIEKVNTRETSFSQQRTSPAHTHCPLPRRVDRVDQVAPGAPYAVRDALGKVKNPLKCLKRMHELVGTLCTQLEVLGRKHAEALARQEKAAKELSVDDAEGTSPVLSDLSPTRLRQASSCALQEVMADNAERYAAMPPPVPASPESGKGATAAAAASGADKASGAAASASAEAGDSEVKPRDHSLDALYLSETFELMLDRWQKLYKDFFDKKGGRYDLTKVPDLYDMVRYDALHNSHLDIDGMAELYDLAGHFENSVVPQEYGIDRGDKRRIGSKMCHALLDKIKNDLCATIDGEKDKSYSLDHSHAEDIGINSLGRCVRTRLYFTSESHLHTLLNVLRFPKDGEPCPLSQDGMAKLDSIKELAYLTQVVIRLFENMQQPGMLRCEVCFSPGATYNPFTEKTAELAPYIILQKSLRTDVFLSCLDNAIAEGLPVGAPDTAASENSTEAHHRRSTEIVVSSSEMEGTDSWEVAVDAAQTHKAAMQK